MTPIIDTNVWLDILLDREPYVGSAAAALSQVENRDIDSFLCATTVTTIHYFLDKSESKDNAQSTLENLLSLHDVASVTEATLRKAVQSPLSDYEDAVLASAGAKAGATSVITRNPSDFEGGPLNVFTPKEFAVAIAE